MAPTLPVRRNASRWVRVRRATNRAAPCPPVAPEEDRLALVACPLTDISLQGTFDMFEDVAEGGIVTRCVDYTVPFVGRGQYFSSRDAGRQ